MHRGVSVEAKNVPERLGSLELSYKWLSICLAMQGMWVQSLVRELRSHTLTGKPVYHNY